MALQMVFASEPFVFIFPNKTKVNVNLKLSQYNYSHYKILYDINFKNAGCIKQNW